MKGSNDNERDTFEPIGLAAARLLRKLDERRDEISEQGRAQEGSGEKQHQEKVSEHDAYVERRIADFHRFERLANGVHTRRKRMT